MHMTFRWFGHNSDTVTLKQIRQVPGVEGIMGFL
ncbi:MAG: mannonate dehydratase, partial [Spirochaetales bacterium]|nr:mannonate dehydratase [Spirochaetales bacterium]